ncbi:MAG: hypothetical protein BroJett024_44120 [Alphaproteobacteria bacterium]|nr:MAG: hypothetical protein BroJett024_44120 [Alphaproteobacteria bacterium]
MSTELVTAGKPQRLVEISVNGRPVSIEGPKATGSEIKQAAIAQGVPIQIDFLLYEELPGKNKPVPDEKEIPVHPNQQFVAIANDDNS